MQLLLLLCVVGSWVYCDALILAVDNLEFIPRAGENAVAQKFATKSMTKNRRIDWESTLLNTITLALTP